jgi:DNA-directed RNA polymerase subunit RPC12/RpoP
MLYFIHSKEREVIKMADLIQRNLRCEYCGGVVGEGDHTTEEDKTGLIRDCMGYCVDCGTRYNWRENYALVSIEPYYVGEKGENNEL